jgi:hypothetical protein
VFIIVVDVRRRGEGILTAQLSPLSRFPNPGSPAFPSRIFRGSQAVSCTPKTTNIRSMSYRKANFFLLNRYERHVPA